MERRRSVGLLMDPQGFEDAPAGDGSSPRLLAAGAELAAGASDFERFQARRGAGILPGRGR